MCRGVVVILVCRGMIPTVQKSDERRKEIVPDVGSFLMADGAKCMFKSIYARVRVKTTPASFVPSMI